MKTFKYFTMAAVAASSLTFYSCGDSDDNGGGNRPSVDDIVEDGFYISGEALPFSGVDVKGRMKSTPNEVDASSREGLYDIYMTLEAGKSFTFTEVKGSTTTSYGPDGSYKINQENVDDNYTGAILKGSYAAGGSFTVDESNLYHIAIDLQTKNFVVVPVTQWSIIGSCTDAGWSDTEGLNILKASYNSTKMTYTATGVVLKEGEFKFRHSGAWKQNLVEDPDVKINTNFSGVAGALSNNQISFTNHLAGGDNAALTKDHRGVYTVSVIWEPGQENFTVSMVKTGDAVIADYPEELWLRGGAITGSDDTGWNADYSIRMAKVPGNSHLFWNIVYLHEGMGFKFDPTNTWNGDFGATGAASAIEDGVEYGKGGDNITVPAATGYYVISVDLKEEKIAVVSEVKIYLTGDDQVGSWGTASPEYMFTNLGEEFESPELKAGALRMFAEAPYVSDWWQREFHIIDGKIAHREDVELTPAQATAGQKAYLNFRTGEADLR